MKAFFATEQQLHQPQTFMVAGQFQAAEEVAERADVLLTAGKTAGLTFDRPEKSGMGPISAVHSPAYLTFLSAIHERWTAEVPNAGPEVIPNLHLDRSMGGYPSSPTGLANFHMADAACPIGPDTYTAALWSAFTAIAATQSVMDGAGSAYALSRPPGHHAYADLAGGFCFLNNSAIAAQMLRAQHDRVAVLDVDVHHGNGTQGIFYRRNDVLTVSLHADPTTYYPFMCGYAHECGDGAGTGYNRNIPLPRSTTDQQYLSALDAALVHLKAYSPGALVLALGLDAFEGDPLQGMQLTLDAFHQIGTRVAALDLPTVVVQEGGYMSAGLGDCLTSFLAGFQKSGA